MIIRTKTFWWIALVAVMLLQTGLVEVRLAVAECPTDGSGAVNYSAIPRIVSDRPRELPPQLFSWNANTFTWDDGRADPAAPYVDLGSWLDIRNLGLCVQGQDLHLSIRTSGMPLTYINPSDSSRHFLGFGALGEEGYSPADFYGLVILQLADADKLSNGAHVYYLVLEYDIMEGDLYQDLETLPNWITLWESETLITSVEEFRNASFSVSERFIEDLTDLDHVCDYGDGPECENVSGQVANEINFRQELSQEFQDWTGIGSNSNLLLRVTTLRGEEAWSTISGAAVMDSQTEPVSTRDSTKIVKFSLNKGRVVPLKRKR